MNLIRLLELAGVAKAPTIVSSTKSNGEIDRNKADKMIDPQGFFPNKHPVQEDGWEDRNSRENLTHSAEDFVLDHFDPEEFIESDVFQDMADAPLRQDEIIHGLEFYLISYVRHHFDDNFNGDLDDAARIVYDQVRDTLVRKGYEIR